MMKNEAEFKSAFKKAVRAQGGYSISLAAPMLAGTPDLYVIMPNYMPILLEAKWLGILGTKFKRKIQYTPMQRNYLDECNRVCINSAMGLIGFKYNGAVWVLLKPRLYKEEIETIDNTTVFNHALLPFTKDLDVNLLFNRARVTRINIYECGTNKLFKNNATQAPKQDGNNSLAP